VAQDLPNFLETEDGDTEMEMEEHDLAGVDLEHLKHAIGSKIYTPYPGINYERCTRSSSTPPLGPW
jgi:hypothetical protein